MVCCLGNLCYSTWARTSAFYQKLNCWDVYVESIIIKKVFYSTLTYICFLVNALNSAITISNIDNILYSGNFWSKFDSISDYGFILIWTWKSKIKFSQIYICACQKTPESADLLILSGKCVIYFCNQSSLAFLTGLTIYLFFLTFPSSFPLSSDVFFQWVQFNLFFPLRGSLKRSHHLRRPLSTGSVLHTFFLQIILPFPSAFLFHMQNFLSVFTHDPPLRHCFFFFPLASYVLSFSIHAYSSLPLFSNIP